MEVNTAQMVNGSAVKGDACREGQVSFSVSLTDCRIVALDSPPALGELRVTGEVTLSEQVAGRTVISADVDGRLWHLTDDSAGKAQRIGIIVRARNIQVYTT